MEKFILTPDQAESYIKLCLLRGDAPIKPAYLKTVISQGSVGYRPLHDVIENSVPTPSSLETQEPLNSKLDGIMNNDAVSDVSCKKRAQTSDVKDSKRFAAKDSEGVVTLQKRERGQNKNRHINTDSILSTASQQLCSVIAATNGTCRFGDECRFLHDKDLFLKNKPVDIADECLYFETRPFCLYGLNCLLSKNHISNGFNITSEGTQVTPEMFDDACNKGKYLNDFSNELRGSLRKRTYNYSLKQKTNILSLTLPHRIETVENQAEVNLKKGITSLESDSSIVKSTVGNNDITELLGPVIISDKVYDIPADIFKKRNEIFCSGKLMLAPLTTLGNLPFRRLCCSLGAEVTMSEMAFALSIIEGRPSELALLKRHPSEKYFGVQIATGQKGVLEKCCTFLENEVACDFVDLNIACPLESLHKKTAGSILMTRPSLLRTLGACMRQTITALPISMKMRMSHDDKWNAHKLIPQLQNVGINAFFVHGRTSRQRYSKTANWDYLQECKNVATSAAIIGNGDIMSWEEYEQRRNNYTVDNVLIGRAALIKPWIFTEIQEKRLWDISASERFSIMKDFIRFGLDNWGSDTRGVETTRRYFLELCSFTHRYIPVGLLERVPQCINWRPPAFIGRSDLETKLGSPNVSDWIHISELLLGPVHEGFQFIPKHKSNAYTPLPDC